MSVRLSSRERDGTATTRTHVGKMIVAATCCTPLQIQAKPQLTEKKQLPFDVDFAPVVAVQGFDQRKRAVENGRMRLTFRQGIIAEGHGGLKSDQAFRIFHEARSIATLELKREMPKMIRQACPPTDLDQISRLEDGGHAPTLPTSHQARVTPMLFTQ